MTDPLAGLSDIELPAAGWPDFFAALALGLLLAFAASLLIRHFAWRPPSAKQRLLTELGELAKLDPGSRLQGQANILKRVKPGAIAGLSEALYQRNPGISPEDVERRLIKIIETERVF